MSDDRSQLVELVSAIVKNHLGLQNDIAATTDLKQCGLDSITFIQIVVDIETSLAITFADSDLISDRMGTIDQIVTCIR
ncbi:acyl carrier protein [Paenibacillus cymbidii]|uniref:acyl carrier protein n=1 Tax=Paenibacillus cymbidii TaxID=1639034 RepID=UPI0010802038|nr:acyl carrier protein [Paenibacillus cymbidii]